MKDALGLARQGLTQGLLLARLLGSGLGTATVQPALPILLVGWALGTTAHAQTFDPISIASIRITSTPEADQSYEPGEKIRIRVYFTHGGTFFGPPLPTLSLTIGSNTRTATAASDFYDPRFDGLRFNFEYEVQASDKDTNGISIPANPLNKGGTGNLPNLNVSYAGLTDQSGHKVNAVAGVKLSTTALTVTEGASETYSVKLRGAPSANVTVAIARNSSGDADLSVNPASLTFTPGNWSTGQTVTVSAAEDTDNTNGSASFTHTASSTDTDYDGLTASMVVTEEDNEGPGVLVSKEALTVRETTPGTYTVQLRTEPSANVTIAITKNSGGDADLSVSPTSLTFTSGNWSTGQTVTVTARRDTDSSYGSASFTHTASSTDTGYAGRTASVVVTAYEIVTQTGIVTADDTTANTASGTVPGGFPVGTTDAIFSATYGTFTIKPDRTWTYTLDNTRAATQGLQVGQTAVETYRLQNTAQTAEFTITITINGAYEEALSFPQDPVSIASIRIISTPEADQYKPGEKIRIRVQLTSANISFVTPWPTLSLTIGSNTRTATLLASRPVDIIYRGIDSFLRLNFEYEVQASDKDTNGISIPANPINKGGTGNLSNVNVSYAGLTDQSGHKVNAVAGVNLSTTALTVTEDASKTYSVKLRSAPSANVTVAIARNSSGDADLSVNPASLTFTPGNWSTGQTVTVSAAEDTDNTNGSATLTHTASSTDTDYDGLTASVVVTEEDNENPGVLVSKEALTVRETTPGTYTVQLHTEPSANVTVAITKDSGGDADLSVSPTSLTFTPGNWNTGQTVTVTARRDTDSNYGSASFTHTASSTDTGYDGLTASVVVTAYEIVTQTGIVTADDTTANTASGTVPGGFPVSTTDATFSAGFTYGTFTIKADRTWTYTLDNTRAATQALQAGQAANETYRLQNTAQTAEFAITITINGADDVILSIAPVAGNGVMVSSSDAQRGEIDEDAASGAVALEVTLSESRTGTVTVAYATADFSSTDTAVSSSSIDPATAGADYTAASDTLTFAAGETRKTITVAISDDINRERDELFKVGLSSATGGAIIASTGSEATILIEDDDPQPKATITASVAGLTSTGAPGATRTAPEGFLSVDEGDSGNTDIIFTMTLEGTDYVNTNFLVTSTDGTATGNEDYRNFFALFPIAAGRTTSTVTLSVIGDENYEPDETVFLNFSLLGLVGVITNSADAVFLVEVTITNDDPVMATSASNLQARPAGSGNLAVSWDPAFSAPNGYSVRWRKASESDSALSAVNTVTATSYTITGLDNDTSYHVRLDTRNLANDGIASNTSLTIDATPTAGVAPTVTAIANQSALVGEPFEVDVDATPGTAGDSLQYQAASSAPAVATVTPTALTAHSASSTVRVTPVAEGTATITVTVSDDTEVGTETFDVTVSQVMLGYTAAPPTLTVDTPITALTATAAGFGSATVTYSVTTGTLPAGLTISATTGAITGTPTAANTSTTTVTVTATAGTGMDAQTATADITFPAVGKGTLAKPTNLALKATSNTRTSFTVTWDEVPNAAGYTATAVQGSNSFTGTVSVPSSGPEAAFSGLTANTTYTVTVTATGDANYVMSEASEFDVTTVANQIPTVGTAIPDQKATVDTAFEYIFPAGTFSDADSDSLTYTAQQTDGTTDSALPTWLTFTASERKLAGTPQSGDTGTLSVKVTASDGTASVSDIFDIVVNVPPALTFSKDSLTVDEGSSGTYTVALAVQPRENVTVTVSGSSDVTVSPTSLTFTSTTWNTAQTVTVTAAPDDDAGDDTATVNQAASGGGYNSVTGSVAVTVDDDDTPALEFNPTEVVVNEGVGSNYTVALATQPSATVTVTVDGTASTDLTVDTDSNTTGNQNTLTFTTTNWSTPQTVMVSAADDADTVDDSVTLSHTVTGGDYGSVTGNLMVRVDDNDSPGLMFTPTALMVDEGRSRTYTVALATQPAGNVTVTVGGTTSSDVTVDTDTDTAGAQDTLTFSNSNWDTAQTVTVSAANDADATDDSVTLTHTTTGYNLVSDNLMVTVDDDDQSLTYSAAPTTLTVGTRITALTATATNFTGTPGYSLTTGSLPAGLRISASTGEITGAPTAASTSTTTVTVRATAGTGTDTQRATANITFPAVDKGRLARPTGLALKTNTQSKTGFTVTWTAVENAMNYTATATPSNGGAAVDGTVDTTGTNPEAVFTGLAANTTYTVSVVATGNTANYLSSTAATLSQATSANSAPMVQNMIDDQTATVGTAFSFTLPADTFSDADSGDTLGYTATKSDNSALSSTWLSFTTATGVFSGTPQSTDTGTLSVKVTANDGTASVSDIFDIVVNVPPALTFSKDSLTVDEGGSGTYTVELATQPTGNVTVAVAVSGSSDVTVSPASLTFTSTTWNTAQTVTVTAAPDADAGDDTATVNHAASGGGYNSVTGSVPVTVDDPDTPALEFAPTSVVVNEGVGSSDYTVALATQPSATVTVTVGGWSDTDVSVDTNDNATGNQNTLTFTTTDWSTAKTVMVSAADDADTIDDSVTLSHTVTGGDYGSVTGNLAVSVDDNDSPGLVFTPTVLTVDEGGSDTYTVALATQPAGNVTVTVGGTTNSDVTVDTDTDTAGAQDTLTFGNSNWDAPQTVTVSAADDVDTVDDSVTLTHTTTGYNSVSDNLMVTVDDDDQSLTYSAAPTTLMVGTPITALTATAMGFGSRTVAYSVTTGTLPAGLTINAITGAITGAPTAASTSTTTVTVTATAGTGTDTQTATANITFPAVGKGTLATPTGLALKPDTRSKTGFTVTWTAVENATTYTATAVQGSNSFMGAVNGTEATFTGLAVNTTYMVSVVAKGNTANYNDSPAGTLRLSTAANQAPTVANMIPDQSATVDTEFSFTVPANTFSDADGDTLTYRATKADDMALPAWLTFNPDARTFSGTPTSTDTGTLMVKVTASDGNGDSISDTFNIMVSTTTANQEMKEKLEAVNKEITPSIVNEVVGRQMAIITDRFATISSGFHMGSLSMEEVVTDVADYLFSHHQDIQANGFDWRQALSGHNFSFALADTSVSQGSMDDGESSSSGSGPVSFWGGIDYSSLEDRIEPFSLDGDITSFNFGVDKEFTSDLVAGVLLSIANSEFELAEDSTDNTYEVDIFTVNPYISWETSDELSLWASVGYGWGQTDLTDDSTDDTFSQGDNFTRFSAGGRFQLWSSEAGTALALKLDGATAHFLGADVQRSRLATELSHDFSIESGVLNTALELGLLMSSADESAAELVGRLHWQGDAGLSSSIRSRILLGGGDRQEWGIGGALRYTTAAEGEREGEGLVVSLEPSFGISNPQLLSELWSATRLDLAVTREVPTAQLNVKLAYGFPTSAGLLTPYTDLSFSETTNTYVTGLRYGLPTGWNLNLKGMRKTSTTDTENTILLELRSDL